MARRENELSSYRRKLLLFIFTLYAASFIFYFFLSVFTFPEKYFLLSFRVGWTFNNSLLRLLETLIPIHCTAVLLSFSFGSLGVGFAKRATTDSSGTSDILVRLITSNLVLFLVLTAIYTFAYIGIRPVLNRNIENQKYTTNIARNFFEIAQEAMASGNLQQSRSYLEFYLTINPGDGQANSLLDQVQKSLFAEGSISQEDNVAFGTSIALLNRAPSELLALAEDYMSREDYFSAYYYSALAYQVAADNGEEWTQAKRFAATAWENLSSAEPDREQREAAELFRMKRRGLEALLSEDKNKMIEAYYIFTSLSRSHPKDVEVTRYVEESVNAIQNITYFLPDAEEIISMPGHRDILFVNDFDDNRRELIYIQKIVKSDAGTYVQYVESLAFEPGGGIVYHLTAPYGQVIDRNIILHGIDTVDPNRNARPEYIIGEKTEPSPNILRIKPSVEELISLSRNQSSFGNRGLLDLWNVAETFAEYGHHEEPSQLESLAIVLHPFSFFIFSCLAGAFGWALKSRRNYPPILSLIFIPGFPFVLYFITELYFYIHRILLGALLLSISFGLSTTITIIEQAILLLFAVFFLAGKVADRPGGYIESHSLR